MKWWHKVLLAPVIVAAVVLGAPILALAAICWLMATATIVVAVSLFWIPRGQKFLIVYSDSTQWKAYFEEEVLPAFGASARVINLSRDGGWKKWWHLDWAAYRHCAGYRNRFPAVYRFTAFGAWRSIRFYDAFMLSNKGNVAALDKAKADLLLWKPKNA
jgi:hypothetical protein